MGLLLAAVNRRPLQSLWLAATVDYDLTTTLTAQNQAGTTTSKNQDVNVQAVCPPALRIQEDIVRMSSSSIVETNGDWKYMQLDAYLEEQCALRLATRFVTNGLCLGYDANINNGSPFRYMILIQIWYSNRL